MQFSVVLMAVLLRIRYDSTSFVVSIIMRAHWWPTLLTHYIYVVVANLIILKSNSSFRSVASFADDWRAPDCLF